MLTLDSNSYPAVVEGRVVWVVDGYTTSDSYPNSQRVSLAQAIDDSQTDPSLVPTDTVNYMRNSVKAVVDAYDGTVTLYEWDAQDPVLKTWEKAYPRHRAAAGPDSGGLMSHLRYPEDLFKVQREMLARYHVSDPNVWFQNNDLWEIPRDPVAQNNQKETPYYLSIRWPSVQGQPAIPRGLLPDLGVRPAGAGRTWRRTWRSMPRRPAPTTARSGFCGWPTTARSTGRGGRRSTR